jgi:hypothetical protein
MVAHTTCIGMQDAQPNQQQGLLAQAVRPGKA